MIDRPKKASNPENFNADQRQLLAEMSTVAELLGGQL